MSEINYKVKYEQIKLKFMSSVDMAFRLGYENGQKDSQTEMAAGQQQAAEQQAQQQSNAEANGFGGGEGDDSDSDGDGMGDALPGQSGMPGEGDSEDPNQDPNMGGAGQPGQPGLDGSEADPEAAPVDGSELDSHISQLEQMTMGKSEVSVEQLKKSLIGIKRFKEARDLHKSMNAIKQIGNTMKKSTKKHAKKMSGLKPTFNVNANKQAAANLTDKDKAAINGQEKIVADIMKSWDEQDKKSTKKITDILNIEGLTKKE